MYTVKIKYASGSADVMRCTEDEARSMVVSAFSRMAAGQDGITDVISYPDF